MSDLIITFWLKFGSLHIDKKKFVNNSVIIPPVYKVYRGYMYIDFVFSVTMFVGVCKLCFGTNVGYDLLYCVRENQPPAIYHFLYLSIF